MAFKTQIIKLSKNSAKVTISKIPSSNSPVKICPVKGIDALGVAFNFDVGILPLDIGGGSFVAKNILPTLIGWTLGYAYEVLQNYTAVVAKMSGDTQYYLYRTGCKASTPTAPSKDIEALEIVLTRVHSIQG